MQRRAAAVLFVFFMVMGASAYSVIALAEEPQPNLESAESYENGSNFTVDGQEYQVLTSMSESSGGGGGHGGGSSGPTASGTLQWYVPSTAQNQTFENGTAAEVFNGTWLVTTGVSPNQDVAYVNASGGVIPYANAAQATGGSSGNGSENASGGNSSGDTSAGNASAGSNTSSGTGGTSTPAANGTNASGNATGGSSNATTASNGSSSSQNGSNASGGENDSAQQSGPSLYTKEPNTLVFTNATDVAAVLKSDSAVYNETSTSEGQVFVRYRSNDSFVPLSQYLPDAEQKRVKQGETFALQIEIETYDGTKTADVTATVSNVTNSSAVVDYEAPQYNSVDLASGENVTLANGETRVVNLKTSGHGNDTAVSAQLGSDYSEYAEQAATQESFGHRMTGLWNIILICAIAGLLGIGLAFLPVRG